MCFEPSGWWEIVKLAAQQPSIAVAGPKRWNRILRAPIEKSGGNFCLSHPFQDAKASLFPKRAPVEGSGEGGGLGRAERRPWIGHGGLAKKGREKEKEKTEKNPRPGQARRGKASCRGMQAGYECSARIWKGSLRPVKGEKLLGKASSKLCRLRLSLVVQAWSSS